MQVPDMKGLRAICTVKRLLKPTTLPNPSLISFQSLQNPTFSRHFHSTGYLRHSGEDDLGPSSLVNVVSETEKDTADRSVGKVSSGTVSVSGIGVSEKVRSCLPSGKVKPVRLNDVNRGISWKDRRIPLHGTFGSEVATVLGGGIVPGSLVLIGGDPGVGKSTLLLQQESSKLAEPATERKELIIYTPSLLSSSKALIGKSKLGSVSCENNKRLEIFHLDPFDYQNIVDALKGCSGLFNTFERPQDQLDYDSIEQIRSRADRLGIKTEDLFLYSSTDMEDILKECPSIAPLALIVDSIQTVYLKGVAGCPGGIVQVRACTSDLLHFAKTTNIPVILSGHVTKSGEIAGPRLLEHIVDVVLYLEGEKHSSYRLLRSVKNRFGSTDELGVFEMLQSGLQAVSNPGGMFLAGKQISDSEYLAGIAVAVIMNGSRSFLIEIQALCISGQAVLPTVNGIQASRASMIISVLAKQAGLKLQDNAIFLNVSGVTLKETASDLAIAAAICSSFLESPIPNTTAFIGEIGLCGELHPVPAMDKRINTVAKLGYRTCIVPKSAETSLRGTLGFDDIKIISCKNLKEVINSVFRSN